MKSNPWRGNYPRNLKFPHEYSLSGYPSQSRPEAGVPNNSGRNPTFSDRTSNRKLDDSKEIKNPVYCYSLQL